MSLDTLKTKLQEALSESIESKHFIEAISDGLYSTGLSVVALEQWGNSWAQVDSHFLAEDEISYQEGVQFVANLWEEIKGGEANV